MSTKVKTKRQIQNDAVALRGGAGKHGDRRTKRLRTRGARDRAALREFA